MDTDNDTGIGKRIYTGIGTGMSDKTMKDKQNIKKNGNKNTKRHYYIESIQKTEEIKIKGKTKNGTFEN